MSIGEKTTFESLQAASASLANKDPELWGKDARALAQERLGWIDLPESSRAHLPALDALAAWSRSQKRTRFVLSGMGGSSLAPEVIAATYGKRLTVLDSTDPSQVIASIPERLSHSVIVIGSKSGSTIETASQKLAVEAELEKQGLDPRNHLVIVTDPQSPLDVQSKAAGLRTVNADPNVGGRFSALSAFGLTPAALIGVDVSVILDDAFDAAATFTSPDSSVVLVAAALAESSMQYVGFCDRESNVPGLSEWIEQLIAESTGKDQKGVLPVVVENPENAPYPIITFDGRSSLSVQGTLGGHFIFWEWVTALLSYLLKVDPYNQPNVTEAKEKTSALLERWKGTGVIAPLPICESHNVQVFADSQGSSIADFLQRSFAHKPGYVALMSYLHRGVDDEVTELRSLIEKASSTPTTFGWGPRFLHSTGQFHKGGPRVGSFLQITGESEVVWPIQGKNYGFETLVMAQALGDNEALAARGYPLIRFHLKNRAAGITELLEAARSL